MGKCLPRSLLISLVLIILGIGFLWEGWSREEVKPVTDLTVTKVIDGDTIKLANGQVVRLIGIDTPETKDPRRPVGCFGQEAANETKKLLEGKEVIVEKDISETDKYNRLLRYVYLPLGEGKTLFVNDYLVREGFAFVLTYPPDVKFNEQLRNAEKQARVNRRGLWRKCN